MLLVEGLEFGFELLDDLLKVGAHWVGGIGSLGHEVVTLAIFRELRFEISAAVLDLFRSERARGGGMVLRAAATRFVPSGSGKRRCGRGGLDEGRSFARISRRGSFGGTEGGQRNVRG